MVVLGCLPIRRITSDPRLGYQSLSHALVQCRISAVLSVTKCNLTIPRGLHQCTKPMPLLSHSPPGALFQKTLPVYQHIRLPSCPNTRRFHPATSHGSSFPDEIPWPTSPNPTPYEIFNLPPTATAAEIKKRYYQLAKKYHPDSRIASTELYQERLQRFRQVVQANELLSTARRRRIYDTEGYGWGDMNVNDIMSDPSHWQGNYEGRFRSAGTAYRQRSNGSFEGSFDGNRAQPYYTSNANFAGGIIVIMVLVGVLQFSSVQNRAQKTLERRRVVHERAALNLRDARSNARSSGRRDMIEAFRQRRDVEPGIYNNEELAQLGMTSGRK